MFVGIVIIYATNRETTFPFVDYKNKDRKVIKDASYKKEKIYSDHGTIERLNFAVKLFRINYTENIFLRILIV